MWTELGITLIVIGLLLLVMEIHLPGFFIGIPATVSIMLGIMAIVLQDQVNTWPVFFVGLCISVATFYGTILLYQRIAPPEKQLQHVSAGDSLVGKIGTVMKEVDHETIEGDVRIEGQIHSARAYIEEHISPDTKVEVVETRGVHVVIKRMDN